MKKNDSSEFGAACDAVVTSLTEKGAMNFEIRLEMIPRQMNSIEPSSSSEMVRIKRKYIVLMSDDDNDSEFLATSSLPGWLSTSPTARPGSTLTVQPTLSQRAIPIRVAIPSQKEKVILQSRTETKEPQQKTDLPTEREHTEENNVIDDEESSSDSGSGSSCSSAIESDGENEDRSRRSLGLKEHSTLMASMTRPCTALSPLNTPADPVIPRQTLTLFSSSTQEEDNLANHATTPVILTLSPEPVARPPLSTETEAAVAGLVASMTSAEK